MNILENFNNLWHNNNSFNDLFKNLRNFDNFFNGSIDWNFFLFEPINNLNLVLYMIYNIGIFLEFLNFNEFFTNSRNFNNFCISALDLDNLFNFNWNFLDNFFSDWNLNNLVNIFFDNFMNFN